MAIKRINELNPGTIIDPADLRFAADDLGINETVYFTGTDIQTLGGGGLPNELTLASGVQTVDTPILDMSQTWNAGAETFTGVKLAITDTASAAGSLMLDVQNGGNSVLRIAKSGTLYVEGANVAAANRQIGRLESHDYGPGIVNNNIVLGAGATGSPNIRLQVDSTSAHIGLNVGGTGYSAFTVMTDASDHCYTELRSAAMQATGTGNYFKTVCTNTEAEMWLGATRRARFVDPTFSNLALDARVDQASYAALGVTGPTDTFARISLGLDTGAPFLGFGPGATTRDLYLRRQAAGVLEMRNGTNPQVFIIYNTYTSGSNHEWGSIGFSANTYLIGTNNTGGSARPMAFRTAGTIRLTIGAAGGLTVTDANDVTVGTTTGTKIGTATTEKLGFWGATPVVQQVLATGAGATVDNVISLLQTLGLCKQA